MLCLSIKIHRFFSFSHRFFMIGFLAHSIGVYYDTKHPYLSIIEGAIECQGGFSHEIDKNVILIVITL